MRSMQCNVEFGYQLSIRSGTKENHSSTRSNSPKEPLELNGQDKKYCSQQFFICYVLLRISVYYVFPLNWLRLPLHYDRSLQ
jgi:hypothetical protein